MKIYPSLFTSLPITLMCAYLFFCVGNICAKEYVESEKVRTMCKELCTIIKNDGFEPDLLIGLSRGGLQPVGLLAGEKQFNLRNVSTIALTSYSGEKQGEINLVMPLHIEDYKKFKSILIVDDLVDSGKTMEYIKNLLQNELPESTIKTAVLYYKPCSRIKPDYFVEETEAWIVFPWEN